MIFIQEEFFGIYVMFLNFLYIWNSWAYYKWYRDDCYETRQQIRKTTLWVLWQTIFVYVGLFIIIYHIPPEALPDSYEDSIGNRYDFPPAQKQDMKAFALYFIALFGTFFIWFNYFCYKVIKLWASREVLIEHFKRTRLSQNMTGRSVERGSNRNNNPKSYNQL